MNKLEPNMYVRTIDGVMKVKNIYQDGRENMDRFENEDGNIYFFNEIIGEPSFNPIDLIEVGDYVNGEIVTKVSLDNIECNYIETNYSYNRKGLRNKDIKSIVTKEQFSSMELELEEKITELETQKGYEEELTEMENKIKDFMFKLKLDKCYTKELEEFINNYGRGLFY